MCKKSFVTRKNTHSVFSNNNYNAASGGMEEIMKAVIVEIKNGFAAVLSDDGRITKTKNYNYEIGQVIQLKNTKEYITKKFAVCAASVAVMVLLGVSALAYATPYSYVSIDINPSIEYSINRFDRVLSVRAVNDDGEEILKEIKLSNLKNKTINQALSLTLDQIADMGYYEGNVEGGLVIATSGKNQEKADELAKELQESAEENIEIHNANITVEAISVGLDRVQEAKELGVTPGKLNLVQKLQASSSETDIVITDWLNKSVKEIMLATKENRKISTVTGSAITLEANETATDKKDNNKAASKEEKETEKNLKSTAKAEKKENLQTEKAIEKATEQTNKKNTKKETASTSIATEKDDNDNDKDTATSTVTQDNKKPSEVKTGKTEKVKDNTEKSKKDENKKSNPTNTEEKLNETLDSDKTEENNKNNTNNNNNSKKKNN